MPQQAVSVGALINSRPETFGLPLEVVAGVDGLARVITSPHIQKTGLALAGFHEYLKPGRVLIFGESEIRYLESLETEARVTALRLALTLDFPCVLITGGFTPPRELVVEAERASLPLLKTTVATPAAIAKLSSLLEDSLAERTIVHAVLMDILGLGVLLVGESGIGKSECALDLIYRGHRLIADDMVVVKRHPNNLLLGYSNDLIRHHMELRGIGIIDIKDLFGVASTRDMKPIDLIVKLEKWVEGAEYDRLGVAGETYELLGVAKPYVRLPVASGRNLALLVEIAARNHLMKLQGVDSARDFTRRIDEQIAKRGLVGAGKA